ncbi:MAG: acyltransferase [Prevotella sp.]|nr:acyltransferase [Prevotella sp.]
MTTYNLQISKEHSQIIKGVAILMMLWLHLFNSESRLLSAGVSDLTIGGISLAYLFSKACNPVSIFIILSGYGLRISFLSGRLSIKNITKRLCYLYCFYWVTLALFVTIGAFISPDRYPKGVSELILNITSYSSSYNGETWFLFPYFCLNLTCLFLFKLQDKIGNIATLIASGLLYGIACYIISRYIVLTQTYDSVLSHIVTYLSFYFPFYLGSFMGDLWGEETRREEKRREEKQHYILRADSCSFSTQNISIFSSVHAFYLHVAYIINCPNPSNTTIS